MHYVCADGESVACSADSRLDYDGPGEGAVFVVQVFQAAQFAGDATERELRIQFSYCK